MGSDRYLNRAQQNVSPLQPSFIYALVYLTTISMPGFLQGAGGMKLIL